MESHALAILPPTRRATPDWLEARASGQGYKLLFDTVDFDFTNLQYNHDRADPAALSLKYDNGIVCKVWLRESKNESFAQIFDARIGT